MDDATARALNAINRAFYQQQAQAFSETREGPWPGWERVVQLPEVRALPADARVLDVGCGNARLGRFLCQERPALRYTGLDASAELLAFALERGELGAAPELLHTDLVEDDLSARLSERRFHLIACFGVLHHLPGRERRRALLASLLRSLEPEGLLALTCWQLALFERFGRKVLPWSDAPVPVDAGQLEPGDHLLPWGHGDGVRYVHFAHEDETAELLDELPCRGVAHFRADGKSHDANRYFVVRRD